MVKAIDQLFDSVAKSLGEFDRSSMDLPHPEVPEDGFEPWRNIGEGVHVRSADEHRHLKNISRGVLHTDDSISTPDSDRRLLEGGLRNAGIESLAFYKSRRVLTKSPFPGKWGIFYLDAAIQWLAEEIAQAFPGYGDPEKLALEFVRKHERYHYEFDVFSLMLESVVKRHLYAPFREMYRYRQAHCVEEALANHKGFCWARKPSIGLHEWAFEFMKCQPDAYSRFDEPEQALQAELAAGLLEHQIVGNKFAHSASRWFSIIPGSFLVRSQCPEYVFAFGSLADWIPTPYGFPDVKEIRDSEAVVKKLSKKLRDYQNVWEKRKSQLKTEPTLKSLNFKPWTSGDKGKGLWSVRVNGNFRAHLRNVGDGVWVTEDMGSHSAMGHG